MFATPEQEYRRSARVRKMRQFFEQLATVALGDPGTMEKDTKSSDKEQWQKRIEEILLSIEDNQTWSKTALPS